MRKTQRLVRLTCTGVLALAMLLRLGGSGAELTPQARGKLASFFLYLQTGGAVALHPVPSEQTMATLPPATTSVPENTPETEPPKEKRPLLEFTAEDMDYVSVKYKGDYRPELERLLLRPCSLDFSGQEPRILILHTHATESYTQSPGWEYTPSEDYRTPDGNYNVLRVGRYIAEILNRAGIPTLHDCTLHDYPSYSESYRRSLQTAEHYLQEYPSITMVIDVHRDSVEGENGKQVSMAVETAGVMTSRLMLVMGTDEGGQHHPQWQENLSWALKLQAQLEKSHPGLTRTLSLRTSRFNQHLTPGSILVEVGTAGDTMPQALAAAELFAGELIRLIQGLELDIPGENTQT